MKIVVLAGGLSPERDVSLSSGSLITNALMESGHEVCLLDVYLGVDSFDLSNLFVSKKDNKKFEYKIPKKEPVLAELKKNSNNGNALIGKNVIEICKLADVVFIALHGGMGENGQLQATLDSLGIKYTGSSYDGCLLAMNKEITKKLIEKKVPTAKWISFNFHKHDFSKIIDNISFPCVVKPCGCGSSVGVSIVNNIDELKNALELAKIYENDILIESFIKGREFSVGILDGKSLPPIEIIPKSGFYDYINKYQAGCTEEICPADLSQENNIKLSNYALKVHELLKLGSYSRVDFILGEDGEFYCLEANTLPGMTPMSLLPQEAKANGISYVELCDKIVKMAFKKQKSDLGKS